MYYLHAPPMHFRGYNFSRYIYISWYTIVTEDTDMPLLKVKKKTTHFRHDHSTKKPRTTLRNMFILANLYKKLMSSDVPCFLVRWQ